MFVRCSLFEGTITTKCKQMKKNILLVLISISTLHSYSQEFEIRLKSGTTLRKFVVDMQRDHYQSLERECLNGVTWILFELNKAGKITSLETSVWTPIKIDSFIRNTFKQIQIAEPELLRLKGKLMLPLYYYFDSCPTVTEFGVERKKSSGGLQISSHIAVSTKFPEWKKYITVHLLPGVSIFTKFRETNDY
jgi:hypothetical protein